jgi:hypothetical protein
MARFSPQTEQLLRAGGWFPGRTDEGFLVECVHALGPEFQIHQAAQDAIREFGGLRVGENDRGVDFARSDINFDPRRAWGESDRLRDYFSLLRDRNAFPLGEAGAGHTYIAVDSMGVAYDLMDEVYLIGDSVDALIETLLSGTLSSHCRRAELNKPRR